MTEQPVERIDNPPKFNREHRILKWCEWCHDEVPFKYRKRGRNKDGTVNYGWKCAPCDTARQFRLKARGKAKRKAQQAERQATAQAAAQETQPASG